MDWDRTFHKAKIQTFKTAPIKYRWKKYFKKKCVIIKKLLKATCEPLWVMEYSILGCLALKLGKTPNHKRFCTSIFFALKNTRNFDMKNLWKILVSPYCFSTHPKYNYCGIQPSGGDRRGQKGGIERKKKEKREKERKKGGKREKREGEGSPHKQFSKLSLLALVVIALKS